MRVVRFLVRLTRVAAYLWVAGCIGFFVLGVVLTLLPFPVAWPGPVPWSLRSDFVETPDGRILICLRYFCEVRSYDRSGSFLRAYPFPKTAGSAYLAAREDNVVYLYGIGYWDEGTIYGFDANWNLVFQERHFTPRAQPSPWELSPKTGQPQWAPKRESEARVDRVARRGDLLFSRRNDRSVFHCADGGMLERHGQTLVRRSAAGNVLFTCAEPWPMRLCALPWPGYLAFLAVVGLWLGKRLMPAQKDLITIRSRPTRISAKDNETCLRIAWCWFRRSSIRVVFFCLGWNAFLIIWLSLMFKAGDEAGWLAVFFGTPHAISGALLLYATLALLLNRTIIKATHEFLTVCHGPVPWYGNRKLPVGELARLYCQQDDKKKNEANSSYSIYALKKGGLKIEFVDEFGRDQALFIVQKLERWLKIEDGGIGPEMHS